MAQSGLAVVNAVAPLRPIRSYVRREGRMTDGQRRALRDLWPRYGVDLNDTSLDLGVLFGRDAPTIVEIGFGNGAALCAAASAHPEQNYLGIEVYRPGVGTLLRTLKAAELGNVRVCMGDANDVFGRLPIASLTAVQIFFPDPWPKTRHKKRRLVQPEFVERVGTKLKAGGHFHIATDWAEYAHHILAVLAANKQFTNVAGAGQFAPRPDERPRTRFEVRGTKQGHVVYDLIFQRVD